MESPLILKLYSRHNGRMIFITTVTGEQRGGSSLSIQCHPSVGIKLFLLFSLSICTKCFVLPRHMGQHKGAHSKESLLKMHSFLTNRSTSTVSHQLFKNITRRFLPSPWLESQGDIKGGDKRGVQQQGAEVVTMAPSPSLWFMKSFPIWF